MFFLFYSLLVLFGISPIRKEVSPEVLAKIKEKQWPNKNDNNNNNNNNRNNTLPIKAASPGMAFMRVVEPREARREFKEKTNSWIRTFRQNVSKMKNRSFATGKYKDVDPLVGLDGGGGDGEGEDEYEGEENNRD